MADVLVVQAKGTTGRKPGGAAQLMRPLRQRRHRVTPAQGIDDALSQLNQRPPDLLVLPVALLDRNAIPLIESLCDPGQFSQVSLALYWDQVCSDEAGGPRPFGAGLFFARAADVDRTCDRLLACLDPGAVAPALTAQPA